MGYDLTSFSAKIDKYMMAVTYIGFEAKDVKIYQDTIEQLIK